jgi:hypothetical protein
MIPIVAGLLMGAAMGGGIAALQKKDVLQGALMGGIGGALGGAFMPAAGGIGNVAGEGVAAAASSTNPLAADIPGIFANTAGTAGAAGTGGIGSFLSANKYALAGGLAGGMMAPAKEVNPADTGNIYTTAYNQERNPEFGMVAGASPLIQGYDTGSYSKASDYNPTMTAANGGIIALAEGGKALELEPYQPVETNRYNAAPRRMTPEVAAYNQQLMARANQQYNVNPRPLPIQVPGSPGYIAPTFNAPSAPASTGEFGYDPVTRRYTGIGGLAEKEKSELERMREEMNAMKAERSGYNHASIDGGGNANGGLMSSYAGGGLSSLGSYSDGGQLLKGPGDGVSDDIPAQIGARQPARLADGEFVVPARIVSELGNGSTDAGAKRLYAMMDRVQKGRKKSIGKNKVAVDSKAHKMLPA